jgi:hypothetical protein
MKWTSLGPILKTGLVHDCIATVQSSQFCAAWWFYLLRSSWLANDLRHVIVERNYHEDPENTRNSFCEENIALFDVKEIVTHSYHCMFCTDGLQCFGDANGEVGFCSQELTSLEGI